jgi:type I restriction enzyme S subunit
MLAYMRLAAKSGSLTAYTSQTSIAHLTREKLALLPIPLPSIEEQRLIVAALAAHDRRQEIEESYRDKLKRQKQGLMDDLLTGRVNDLAEVSA